MNEATNKTAALILGGGGIVGVAWQVGLLAGLQDAGVELTRLDSVLGTSAGSVVGALLSAGQDVKGALGLLGGLSERLDPAVLAGASGSFRRASEVVGTSDDPREALKAVGQAILSADAALAQDDYVRLFAPLAMPWPKGFASTAISASSGEVVVMGEDSGVPLDRAIAASCVVPFLFPPVTIDGIDYIDGGLHSHLNASLAPAADVVIVVSCLPLGSEDEVRGEGVSASTLEANREVAQLRARSNVVTVQADLAALPIPGNMLAPGNVGAAVQLGALQAERVAGSILAALAG